MDKKDYIFGKRPIIEAIESGKSIDKIFIKRELSADAIKELLVLAKTHNILIQKVPEEKLNRITMKNHQGVIALITPIRYYQLDDLVISLYEEGKTPCAIILDGITDAGNFGAIARSVECAGGNFIIIPEKGSASVTSDAIRASAGALLHVPVCRVKDIPETIDRLHENGYKVIASTEKGSEDYTMIDFRVPVAIVMGSEYIGISDAVLRKCDELASIPVKGKVGSLNVSAAAAVMLYEVVKQRS